MMNRKQTQKLIVTIKLIALISFSYYLLFRPTDKVDESQTINNNEVQEVIKVEEEKIDFSSIFSKKEYKEYKKINSDYIGQIIFESGIINEPIVYSSTNGYYLRRNINKDYSIQGTISDKYVWLRSANADYSSSAFYAYGGGYVYYNLYNRTYGVRPAFVLDLSKLG